MKLIKNLDEIRHSYNNAVVTIGNFDGVHSGHKVLFDNVVREAKNIGGTSVVITFDPHPMKVLKNKRPFYLITPSYRKAELIEKTGVDILIIIPFTKRFAELTAGDFLEKILIKKIGMKVIIVGSDYTFGKERGGNLSFLKRHTNKFNYIVQEIADVTGGLGDRISSTKIRKMIAAGEVFEVKDILGRFYRISGKVVFGRKRGKKLLGFPTANIELGEQLPPASGVYAVIVDYRKDDYEGVANIGVSPSFGDDIFSIETHIIDFNRDIYDEKLGITFIKKIRDEQKFAELSELSGRIEKDIEIGKGILSEWRH